MISKEYINSQIKRAKRAKHMDKYSFLDVDFTIQPKRKDDGIILIKQARKTHGPTRKRKRKRKRKKKLLLTRNVPNIIVPHFIGKQGKHADKYFKDFRFSLEDGIFCVYGKEKDKEKIEKLYIECLLSATTHYRRFINK